LPKGFSAVAGDLINGQPLTADYIQNGGQTVTLPFGVDIGAMRTFELRLVGKKLPPAGQYKFRAEYWGIGIGIYNTAEAVLELRN
jgi:Biofilm surface layer A